MNLKNEITEFAPCENKKHDSTHTNSSVFGLLLLIVSFFYITVVSAQFESSSVLKSDTVGYLDVNGYISKNRKPLENASITVYEGKTKVANLRTPSSGKFNLKLEYNKVFNVEITKKGLVTKKFEFDTYYPTGDNQAINPFAFTMVLFPIYKNIDMTILDKPLAIIKYQNKYDDFFYDYEYSKSINNKVILLQNQIEDLVKEYSKSIDKGRSLFKLELYRESLTEFQRAHEIYADEPYPIEQIALIDQILNKEQFKKETYTSLLADAEANVIKKEYENAIDILRQAMKVMPTEKYPAERIGEIRKIMGKLALKEDQYKIAITNADNSFSKKMYTAAETFYTDAGILFPDRTYPKDRIAEIHKIQSEINTETLYDIAIAEGDSLFKTTKYLDAILAYKKAIPLKSGETYAKERIDFINKKLSDLSIIEISYKHSISEADKFMSDKDYEIAKIDYNKAGKLKPDEQYPKIKIQEIDIILNDIKSIDDAFNKIIVKADGDFGNKDYQSAIDQYNLALTYKPDEKYPVEQILKIKNILSQNSKLESKYLTLITLADKLYDDKDYLKAKISYQDASLLKNEEQYPRNKISDIDKMMADEQDKVKSYTKKVKEADDKMDLLDYKSALSLYKQASGIIPDEKYPQVKIEEINNILQENQDKLDAYSRLLLAADLAMFSKYYVHAQELYQKALEVKPGDIFVKKKLDELEQIIKKIEANRDLYYSTIKEADDLFNLHLYKEAREQYVKAHDLNPIQKYPVQRIEELNDLLHNEEYVKAIGEIDKELIERMSEKKFSFNHISVKNEYNYIIIEARNLSYRSYKLLVFYGNNEERTGGFELEVKKEDNVETYKVRVGVQDNWVNQQNNWISIQPLGGNLEVISIQIQKGN